VVAHADGAKLIAHTLFARSAGLTGDWNHARLSRGGDRENPRGRSAGQGDSADCPAASISAVAAVLIHEAIRRSAHLRVAWTMVLLRLMKSRDPCRSVSARTTNRAVHVDAQKLFLGEGSLAQRSRTEAQDHRPAVSFDVFEHDRRKKSAAPISWRRARSIPM